jgi:hypothetical protein
MNGQRHSTLTASCACGNVVFEATGTPIASVVCYCDDCQEGGRRIEALPNAPAVRAPDGGTAYIVFRKDRVACAKGAALLVKQKIKEKTATNRLVATCCNSAMVLNFDDAKHWVSMYRARFKGPVPPVEMLVCTRFKPGNAEMPSGVPAYARFPPAFLGKLLAARIAMLFYR